MRNVTRFVCLMTICFAVAVPVLAAGQTKTHLGGKPSEMLVLRVGELIPGEEHAPSIVHPDGETEALVIPDGSVLVVTDVVIRAEAAGMKICLLRGVNPANLKMEIVIGPGTMYRHLSLSSGVVFGDRFRVVNAAGLGGGTIERTFLYGYLAKDR